MFCNKWASFVMVFLVPALLFASGGEEKKEEAKPGEHKEESKDAGHGEAKSTTTQEILNLQAEIQTLTTKIRSSADTIKKLTTEKEETRDEKKALEIVNQMKEQYKEYLKSVREYEEKRSLLNYRYPEKGLKEDRTYERIEAKSLEEMETEFSLDGRVKRSLVKLRRQYPMPELPSHQERAPANSNEAEVAAKKDPSRNSVTQPQILSR